MTLQEFISQEPNKTFLEYEYKIIKQNMDMMKITQGRQSITYLQEADKHANYIYGFINAAFAYGRITKEESTALREELSKETAV